MSDLIRIGPGQVLQVSSATADTLELESTWDPGGSPAPRHWHPRQREHDATGLRRVGWLWRHRNEFRLDNGSAR